MDAINDFSVWLRTSSNLADNNRFQTLLENVLASPQKLRAKQQVPSCKKISI